MNIKADRSELAGQIGCCCPFCAAANLLDANFCGNCGKRISQRNLVQQKTKAHCLKLKKILLSAFRILRSGAKNFFRQTARTLSRLKKIKIRYRSNLTMKTRIVSALISCFLLAFLGTWFILRVNAGVAVADGPFADVPLDHPLYTECRELLRLDGCRIKDLKFAPYEMIDKDSLNQALLAAIRYNRLDLKEDMLFAADLPDSKGVYQHFSRLAQASGRKNRFDSIEPYRFDDQTRFNIYSLIETIFLEKRHEN